jgi:regulatory protein
MIPMRNRKKTLEITMEEMRNFSFSYIEKYTPSKQQLRTYLLKKYLKANVPNVKKQDITDLIDIVLVDLEKSKFISDKFYSDSKSRSLIQRGNSINKIRYYLMGKGINEIYIKESIEKIKEDNSDQDFFSGIKICKKKRIGPARAEDNRPLFYKKDISLLARNGFDFQTSKRIMDIDQSEYLKIVKLL